jgi:hypothetical protein
MPLKEHYSIQNRVIIANTFLTSILSFLHRYFLMPIRLVQKVKTLITSWIVPAHRFTYEQLTAPTRTAGLCQPLRDVEKMNIAALLRGKSADEDDRKYMDLLLSSPFSPSPASAVLVLPPNHTIAPSRRFNPKLIWSHVQEAASRFCLKTDGPAPARCSAKKLYAAMMTEHDTISVLAAKLNPRDYPIGLELASELARNIMTNTRLLPARLPSDLRYHSFLLIHNALPTRHRESWRGWDTSCPLCNNGEETLAHLHTKCLASTQAISLISQQKDGDGHSAALSNAFPEDFLFRTPDMKADQLTSPGFLSLCMAHSPQLL